MAQGPNRREPRSFEPPPWELEQFERLERERSRREQEAAPEPVTVPVPEPAGESTVSAGSVPDEADPAELDAMFLALKAEEPPAMEGAWKFGLVSAALVGFIGLMLVVWGAVALARTVGSGPAGVMGAMIMSVMGSMFVALAAWVGVRSLKQRGVL